MNGFAGRFKHRIMDFIEGGVLCETNTDGRRRGTVSILCVDKKSNYKKIPGLDLWDEERNAYNYAGSNPVICHPPCQQWSRMKAFATENKEQKELAIFCWEVVNKNGGILEHPNGSNLFKYVRADKKFIYSVNQHWWGFPARKTTLLYVKDVKLLAYPLNFNAIQKKVNQMNYKSRSIMTLEFCQYLVNSVLYGNL